MRCSASSAGPTLPSPPGSPSPSCRVPEPFRSPVLCVVSACVEWNLHPSRVTFHAPGSQGTGGGAVRILVVGRTDPGRQREHNEDSLLADPEAGLFAVADGMGGHEAGEVASALALAALHESLAPRRQLPASLQPPALDALAEGMRLANRRVFEAGRHRPADARMGTTLVSALIEDAQAAFASVGDSRIYRLRDEALDQLSRDHSLVWELVARGEMSPEEARHSPHKHVITRAVGMQPAVEVDAWTEPVQPGDVYLLCSDGLTDEVTDSEILEALLAGGADLEAACQALLDLANRRGGRDNITALLVRYEAAPAKA
ncbi:MAG: Stp1/IreP family PP2C-type Ser/Thr phosphatase [candidate division NC10 bacterium]|nr:Stp1/IreP family PP2C-type Ser/Thr phosphatase [candidate division NC10 bacterium]